MLQSRQRRPSCRCRRRCVGIMLVAGVLDVAADRLARTALRASRPRSMPSMLPTVPSRCGPTTCATDWWQPRRTSTVERLADIDRAIVEARRATDWSSRGSVRGRRIGDCNVATCRGDRRPDDVAAALGAVASEWSIATRIGPVGSCNWVAQRRWRAIRNEHGRRGSSPRISASPMPQNSSTRWTPRRECGTK